MNINFLSTLIPKEMYDDINNKSVYNMSDAADALQWKIHEGLCVNYSQNVCLLNMLPVGSFPQYYKDAFVKSSFFSSDFGSDNYNIGFCNVKLIRKVFTHNNIYRILKKSYTTDDGILFVYSASSLFMKAVWKLKRKYRNIKVCVIIADLPDMVNLSSNQNLLKRFYIKYLAHQSYKYLKCADGFVLLTEQMASYLDIKKPYCVMEGIATDFSNVSSTVDATSSTKKIMYSGTLHKRFGIMNLVEAFMSIPDPNYELLICGVGDCETMISELSEQDYRIKFYGKLPRNEVLVLQASATVLVNPRQNIEEFTKYSFPSKTLEYLSSGKPVIAYKLDGIPDEYDKHIQYVSDNSIQALQNKIIELCSLPEYQLRTIGESGRRFVADEKNKYSQTKKIVEFVKKI